MEKNLQKHRRNNLLKGYKSTACVQLLEKESSCQGESARKAQSTVNYLLTTEVKRFKVGSSKGKMYLHCADIPTAAASKANASSLR